MQEQELPLSEQEKQEESRLMEQECPAEAAEPCDAASEVSLQMQPTAKEAVEEADQETEPEEDAVLKHTAGLWQYIPIPADEPEPYPEYRTSHVQFPSGRLIAARVRGKKHKHEGTNCDDWYEADHVGEMICAAVSDGAGSKKFSRIGAKAACEAAVAYLKQETETLFSDNSTLQECLQLSVEHPQFLQGCAALAQLVQESVLAARKSVEEAFAARAEDPAFADAKLSDFAGTLLSVLCIPVGEEQLVISCQIGDGCIALVNRQEAYGKAVKIMGDPDSGEFSGETEFLVSPKMQTMEALQSRTKISKSRADYILLMSDGVADDYFPVETAMYRLYLDLLVNGILPLERKSLSDLTQADLRLFKKIPDPLAYPWVNDPQQEVALQYTDQICQKMHITPEALWTDDTILSLAALQLDELYAVEDEAERLKIWLDNYVKRGSFDDRTLVIIER